MNSYPVCVRTCAEVSALAVGVRLFARKRDEHGEGSARAPHSTRLVAPGSSQLQYAAVTNK